jgi:hypothetical protein
MSWQIGNESKEIIFNEVINMGLDIMRMGAHMIRYIDNVDWQLGLKGTQKHGAKKGRRQFVLYSILYFD